ncbi:MAG TPA: HAMP domain-containing sensor histidine kinase [Vicinamibacterales bacterium]|nr:HAMP domain-containing sensor histidine kinase [Vicinamibacterales bacterium]
MLHEFIAENRPEIASRASENVRRRPRPPVSTPDFEHGVAVFLTQVSETLAGVPADTTVSGDIIGSTAARHGAKLLAAGFTVSQVVHDYGDICQAITEIAGEQNVAISVPEVTALNRCLDIAIAEAVTEHTRLTTEKQLAAEVERLGRAAHELRDLLHNAVLAFHAIERGVVPISGSTAGILGRSLTSLRRLVDRTLSEVRLAAGTPQTERLEVATLIEQITSVAALHAESRGVRFSVAPVDHALIVEGDPQLLTSAVMNLLHNGFKNTSADGCVTLRAYARDRRLLVEIEDQCGGIPQSKSDLFQPFGDRRGRDRAGLGLGLSIARQAVRAHEGDIRVRNMPGVGCVFTIDVPLAHGGVDMAARRNRSAVARLREMPLEPQARRTPKPTRTECTKRRRG